MDLLQRSLHIKRTLYAESDQSFAVGCQKPGRQIDWKVDGTVRQLELVSAERSASSQTQTCRPGPAASTPTNQRRLKFQFPVLKLSLKGRKGEGKWFNLGAGMLVTHEEGCKGALPSHSSGSV